MIANISKNLFYVREENKLLTQYQMQLFIPSVCIKYKDKIYRFVGGWFYQRTGG